MSKNDYPFYVRNEIIKYQENGELTKYDNTLEQQDIPTIFAEYPMQEYKEKHWLKTWSENSKDINHLNCEILIIS